MVRRRVRRAIEVEVQSPQAHVSTHFRRSLHMSSSVSRRQFLRGVAATAVVGPFADARLLGQERKIRHASIGAAGQALSDIRAFSRHPAFTLAAVADVDLARTEQVKKLFPDVRVYQDWREMFRKEGPNIDSVSVSTPDHMH